jgi:hypothetical protein
MKIVPWRAPFSTTFYAGLTRRKDAYPASVPLPTEDKMGADTLSIPASADRQSRLSSGLLTLVEAADDARKASSDIWQFALSLHGLLVNGLLESDLRWLLTNGLLETACEQIEQRKGKRIFQSLPDLSITVQSCFVITKAGRKFATSIGKLNPTGSDRKSPQETGNSIPSWDALARKLLWQGQIVKQFRTPAANQEMLLAAFEALCWVSRIENPLAGHSDEDNHQQLRETVRRLNGRQRQIRIRFTRDGTGRGVCWSGW